MTEVELVPPKVNGRWVAGQSGNPKGRPPTTRDAVNEAKHTLERFIRTKLSADNAAKAVVKMVEMAAEGNTKAAAVIFPYILSKATGVEDDGHKDTGGIVIRIENATIKAQRDNAVTDGEFKEVTNNGYENDSAAN